MLRRLAVALALAVVVAHSQPITFSNVFLYERTSPDRDPKTIKGTLTLDRNSGALIFTVKNSPYVTISYSAVTNLVYKTKDKVLTIQHKDDRGHGQFSEFDLESTNFSYLLDSIEAHTGVRVTRTSDR
jgi:hypothetical protein